MVNTITQPLPSIHYSSIRKVDKKKEFKGDQNYGKNTQKGAREEEFLSQNRLSDNKSFKLNIVL